MVPIVATFVPSRGSAAWTAGAASNVYRLRLIASRVLRACKVSIFDLHLLLGECIQIPQVIVLEVEFLHELERLRLGSDRELAEIVGTHQIVSVVSRRVFLWGHLGHLGRVVHRQSFVAGSILAVHGEEALLHCLLGHVRDDFLERDELLPLNRLALVVHWVGLVIDAGDLEEIQVDCAVVRTRHAIGIHCVFTRT